MKPIATDTYNFEGLITRGYTYVDKTEVIYPLINDLIGKQFFLSRPRRFGKSLLVSTFKSLFQGRRDLFKGLAIDSLDYDWKAYPVLHLDMGSMQAPTVAEFEEKLLNHLMSLSKELDVEVEKSSIPSIVFTRLCEALAAVSPHKQFVMLIDEYDKPLLGTLNTPEVIKFRDALKSFYSVIKTKEGLMRFAFITGISKFSKVSIFSDFNNLIDISPCAPEETYQAVFCAILYLIGVGVVPEVRTNEGRIDAVMETPDHVYVMEFKRDKSAAEALKQIKEHKYYEKFLGRGKKITLVGVNFDSEKRTIAEYLVEGDEK